MRFVRTCRGAVHYYGQRMGSTLPHGRLLDPRQLIPCSLGGLDRCGADTAHTSPSQNEHNPRERRISQGGLAHMDCTRPFSTDKYPRLIVASHTPAQWPTCSGCPGFVCLLNVESHGSHPRRTHSFTSFDFSLFPLPSSPLSLLSTHTHPPLPHPRHSLTVC